MLTSDIKIRHKSAVIESCCDPGCRLRINTTNMPVILKGENIAPQTMICDCLIFQDDGKITMVELKNSAKDASEIFEQLTNGGQKALDIATEEGINNPRLRFLLLANNYNDSFAAHRLAYEKIKLGAKKYPIRRGKCGDFLHQ